jgi:hypothetical protein
MGICEQEHEAKIEKQETKKEAEEQRSKLRSTNS